MIIRLALHSKLYLNIEADLLYRTNEHENYDKHFERKVSACNLLDGRSIQMGHNSDTDAFELKKAEVSACHRLCMQPILGNKHSSLLLIYMRISEIRILIV